MAVNHMYSIYIISVSNILAQHILIGLSSLNSILTVNSHCPGRGNSHVNSLMALPLPNCCCFWTSTRCFFLEVRIAENLYKLLGGFLKADGFAKEFTTNRRMFLHFCNTLTWNQQKAECRISISRRDSLQVTIHLHITRSLWSFALADNLHHMVRTFLYFNSRNRG